MILFHNHTRDKFEDQEAYDRMVAGKITLLRKHPLFGVMTLELPLVEKPEVKTMATNGRVIYYAPEFVRSLRPGEIVFGLAHELYHGIYRHIKRHKSSKIDPVEAHRWNAAEDFFINLDLKLAGIGEVVTTIKMCLDEAYRGWSSEEIYYDLVEKDYAGIGSWDYHPFQDECESGGIGTDVEQDQVWIERIKRAYATHNDMQAKGLAKGPIPEGIKKLIDGLSQPKMTWQGTFRSACQWILGRTYSYTRPNRSMFQTGVTIPGFRGPTQAIDIATAVDASGSMQPEELGRAFSEIKGILDTFNNYKLIGWTFDGDVYEDSVVRLDRRSGGSLQDITKFIGKARGGGGTVFESNWEWMKRNRVRPKLLLVFTDGLPNDGWGDPFWCPTIFVIANDRLKAQGFRAPFGKTFYME